MAKHGAKNKDLDNLSGLLTSYVDVVNATFERLTGKTVPAWLKEFQQRPRELPQGESATTSQPGMPLADAYAILGLPQTASLKEIKRNYRRLAVVFHPDEEGGYEEAMKLLNNAYERVMGEKGGK